MFLVFALKRLDILSTGDLGVQRGMAAYLGKDVAKLKAKGGGKWKYMSEQDMLDHSAPFAPYRYSIPSLTLVGQLQLPNPTERPTLQIDFHVVHVAVRGR